MAFVYLVISIATDAGDDSVTVPTLAKTAKEWSRYLELALAADGYGSLSIGLSRPLANVVVIVVTFVTAATGWHWLMVRRHVKIGRGGAAPCMRMLPLMPNQCKVRVIKVADNCLQALTVLRLGPPLINKYFFRLCMYFAHA